MNHPSVEKVVEVKYNFKKAFESGVDVKFEDWRGEEEIRILSKETGLLSFNNDSQFITDLYYLPDFGNLPNGQSCRNSKNFLSLCREEGIKLHPYTFGPN